ncbi:MAG: DTW domain-containing protein [Myxococcales bacterium]|nr:MAG: DTW domain-containing protein [Myxococcales bacterium]
MKESRPTMPRPFCYRCRRPQSMCLCAEVPSCNNKTQLHVLQDYRERKHPFGTVRILELALANIQTHVLREVPNSLFQRPAAFPKHENNEQGIGILYPGPGSRSLHDLSAAEQPSALVVIDGTWHQAHRIYRDSPWLHALPRFRLQPSEPSAYAIRKEPREECLSSLESVALALALLEPELQGLDALKVCFKRMNERQLSCITKAKSQASPRKKRKRYRVCQGVPPQISRHPQNLVLVYAELTKLCYANPDISSRLLQWSAVRFSEPDDVFDVLIDSSQSYSDANFLRLIEWLPEDANKAVSFRELCARWNEFLRPKDVLVSWNRSTLQTARVLNMIRPLFSLKGLAANRCRSRPGSMQSWIEEQELACGADVKVTGRASRRLAQMHCILENLLSKSSPSLERPRE